MSLTASVIIPTYHSWSVLQRCLDHLADQTAEPSAFEIIVVNNAEYDDVPEDLVLPQNARVIWEPKPGSYAARNAGIAEAQTDLLFFTDADCTPRRSYIENGLLTFKEHPGILRFSGAVELEPAGSDWTVPEIYDRLTCLQQERYARQGRAATANVFVRRAAFEKVGLFDGEALSGGDMEWSRRAQANGLELVYTPDVIVGHPARESFDALATKARRILGAKIRSAGNFRFRYYIPPIKKIIPPTKLLRRAIKDPELSSRQVFQVWGCAYRLRLAMIAEQMRLTWLRGTHERR